MQLILHVGLPKTGSSALQSYLSEHSDELARLGISYPWSAPAESTLIPTSGNGARIAHYIASGEVSLAARELAEATSTDANTLVLSSELFGLFGVNEWSSFKDFCTGSGIDRVTIVAFFREPIGYLSSAYNQTVKRGGEWRALRDWLGAQEWQHYCAAKSLYTVFEKSQLQTLNYDRSRSDMLAHFFSAAQIPLDALAAERSVGRTVHTVNPSLGPLELHYAKLVNLHLGIAQGTMLTDRFLVSDLDSRIRSFFSQQQANAVAHLLNTAPIAQMRSRLTQEVDWVNQHLMTSETALELGRPSGSSTPTVAPRDIEKYNAAVHAIFAEHMISSLRTFRLDAYSEYSSRLIQEWVNLQTCDSESGASFDAFSYAILNPDVMCAGFTPRAHYDLYGARDGRPSDIRAFLEKHRSKATGEP
jgi:hypothetical protein